MYSCAITDTTVDCSSPFAFEVSNGLTLSELKFCLLGKVDGDL